MIDFLKGSITPKDWLINGGILAFTIALGVLFVFLIFLPSRLILKSLDEKILVQEEQLALAVETSENIDALRKDAADMQELVQLFEERLPRAHEIDGLMQTFESFGAQIKGLRVTLSSRTRLSDQEKETIPYDVKASGSFHQITEFINKLERYQRFFKVSELEIAEDDSQGGQAARFVLSTYRFIETAEEEEEK